MGVEGTGESLHTLEAWDDDVSATNCVCVQLWYAFRWGLRPLSTSGDDLPIATQNVELGFLTVSIGDFMRGWGLEREEKKWGLLQSQLEVPAEQFVLPCFI